MSTSQTVLTVLAGLTLAAGAAFAQRIEESSQQFTFQGAWTPGNDAKASGGSHTVSSTREVVCLRCRGTNFVLYRKVDPNGGYATVTVDGQNFGSITFFFQETRWQVPAVIDLMDPGLVDGNHKIVLKVSAVKPDGSGGNNVYIDALEQPAPANIPVSGAFGTVAAPSQIQRYALARTNFWRAKMGIPLARHHLALGLAAHAHAKYLSDASAAGLGFVPHTETFGASPNFTGVSPIQTGRHILDSANPSRLRT